MSRFLPDLFFIALVMAYVVACYAAPSAWWVIAGYACGWGTQMCLEWKRSTAINSDFSKGGAA